MRRIVLGLYPKEKDYDLAMEAVQDSTVILVYGDNSYICNTQRDVKDIWSVIMELVEAQL